MTPLADREHVVYYCFDADDWALYIGVTVNLPQRLRDHQGCQPWWKDVAYIATSGWMDMASAYELESQEIGDFSPPYNQHRNTAHLITKEERGWEEWWERRGSGMSLFHLNRYLENITYFDPPDYVSPIRAVIAAEIARRQARDAERAA